MVRFQREDSVATSREGGTAVEVRRARVTSSAVAPWKGSTPVTSS